ncbi:MAG: MarR family winged helix-turn-helix transcriptional regulator [Acidimicrobiales bacterium]
MERTTDRTELASRLRFALVPLVRRLRQQNGPDLTASQASALGSIAKSGPLTVGELAEVERVTSPMITKIAKNLEEAGLVTRSPDPTDKRITRLALTGAGRRRLERNRTRKAAWLATRLRELDASDLEAIEAIIPVLERLADDASPGRLPGSATGP